MIFTPFYHTDYYNDTKELNWRQDLAYRRLLDEYYRTEKPLPVEKKALYQITRALSRSEKRAVDYVVRRFFKREKSRIVSKRARKEIQKYAEIRRIRVKGGKERAYRAAQAQLKLSKSESSSDSDKTQDHMSSSKSSTAPPPIRRDDAPKFNDEVFDLGVANMAQLEKYMRKVEASNEPGADLSPIRIAALVVFDRALEHKIVIGSPNYFDRAISLLDLNTPGSKDREDFLQMKRRCESNRNREIA